MQCLDPTCPDESFKVEFLQSSRNSIEAMKTMARPVMIRGW